MPTNALPPICLPRHLTSGQCEAYIQSLSVEAAVRSAEAAELANYLVAAGTILSLFALIAAVLAFLESRKAARAAERQAIEATRQANAAIQSIEDARRAAQVQFEIEAAAIRSRFDLKRVTVQVRPDNSEFKVEFSAEGPTDIPDLRLGIEIIFDDPSPGAPIPMRKQGFFATSTHASLKSGRTSEVSAWADHDRDFLRAHWEQSWIRAIAWINVAWTDTFGFEIQEEYTGEVPIHSATPGGEMVLSFHRQRIIPPGRPTAAT